MTTSLQTSKFKLQTSKFRLWFLIFGFFLFFGLWSLNFAGGTAVVSAQGDKQIFGACDDPKVRNSPVCQDRGTTENPVTRVINLVASVLALLAGVVAVIMLIIGGFNFITAGGATPGQRAGDPNKIATAQKQIAYSLVGLLVIALAWAVTRLITDRVIQ